MAGTCNTHGGNTKLMQIIIWRPQTKTRDWKSKNGWVNIARMDLTGLGCEGCGLNSAAL